jgi:hypothetical protein
MLVVFIEVEFVIDELVIEPRLLDDDDIEFVFNEPELVILVETIFPKFEVADEILLQETPVFAVNIEQTMFPPV